jgi:hypothetical protein
MIVRILAGLLLYGCLYPSAQARDYRYSDAHLHYVDFFQETEGMPALLKAMDKAGVEQSMIAGIPVAKKWHEDEPKRPRYYAAMMPTPTGTAPPTCTWPRPWKSWRLRSDGVSIRFLRASTRWTRTPSATSNAYSSCIPGCGRASAKCSPATMTSLH